MKSKFGRLRVMAILGVFCLLASACLGDDSSGGGGAVEIMGAFVDTEADGFEASLEALREEVDFEVNYNGTPDFNTLITTRVEGGDIPDIALFPQPGLLLDIAAQTDAVPISEFLDAQALEESLIPGFLDAVTTEGGDVMGFPMRMALKSALWYPVPEFEEAGYTLPETQEELNALEEQIRSDGGTPWCLGMESGDATGWVGTDWIEENMLRLHGPEVYDQWVNHEVLFDSPEVRAAFENWNQLWSTEGNVVGGTQGMLSIGFGDSPDGLFDEEPSCWLHRQGNFITSFFPDDVQENLDENVGVTYFPPDPEGFDGSPVLAGGDLALMINDTPEARQVMEFLAEADFGGPWAEQGGWLSPHTGFDDTLYPTEVERQLYQIGAQADVLRFDASDSMPGPVGTGAFWTGIVDWVGGQSQLDGVLQLIDQAWPEGG